MANTVIRKKPAKPAPKTKADLVAAAELKTLRLKNIKHASEMYTGGGTDALDQFRTTLGFLLGTMLVMPAEIRAATTTEMLFKSIIDALDNTKALFIKSEPGRLAQMETAMDQREAKLAAEKLEGANENAE